MIAEKTKNSTQTAVLPEAPERTLTPGREQSAVESIRAHADSRVKNRARRPATIWGRRETAAVLVASFTVTLLCLYVAAYARVTAEGFEANRLAKKLKAAQRVEKDLEAEISHLKHPETVQASATKMGMVQAPPGTMQFLNAASEQGTTQDQESSRGQTGLTTSE